MIGYCSDEQREKENEREQGGRMGGWVVTLCIEGGVVCKGGAGLGRMVLFELMQQNGKMAFFWVDVE